MIPCLLQPSSPIPPEPDFALPTGLSPGDRRPRSSTPTQGHESRPAATAESANSRPEAQALTIAREVESFYSPSSSAHFTSSKMTSSPLGMCLPQKPTAFQLKIRFQQLSDPVPAKFSLNTQFLLLRKNLGASALESRSRTSAGTDQRHLQGGLTRNIHGVTSALEAGSTSEDSFLPGESSNHRL
jgi:hypothetical protein